MADTFVQDIKFNCDVSDAQYWGYFSICGLLMRYRDLFRSEAGHDPWTPVSREEIAAWIDRKESRWPDLEAQGFRDLTIKGKTYPPFDIEGINGALNGDGYAYGAGYGMYLKPTFLLGRIRSVAEMDGHRVYTTEREIVRDLFTSAAMLQGRIIFLRLEPLKALLWDKFAGIRPGCDTAVLHAFQIGGIRSGQPIDEDFSAKLDRMVLAYSGVLLQHELAESREAAPQWKEVLTKAGDRNAEHFLRAVQDLVADTSDVGPLHRIVADQDRQSLSLMVGSLDGFRRFLFPGIREAYGRFLRDGDWSIIEEARRNGAARFRGLRQKVLDLFEQGDTDSFSRGLRELMQAPA